MAAIHPLPPLRGGRSDRRCELPKADHEAEAARSPLRTFTRFPGSPRADAPRDPSLPKSEPSLDKQVHPKCGCPMGFSAAQ